MAAKISDFLILMAFLCGMRLLPIIAFCALLAACKDSQDYPCRDQAVRQTFNLTTPESSLIPYNQEDTLLFVSDQLNDTVWFRTDSVYNYYTFKTSPVPTDPDCPADVDAYQGINVAFKDTAKTLSLLFGIKTQSDSFGFWLAGQSFMLLPVQAIVSDSLSMDSTQVGIRKFLAVHSGADTNGDTFCVNKSHGLLRFRLGGLYYNLHKFNSR